ncbi:hypothetical protein NN6n1_35310 [Shinella zoogloeoides]
MQFIELFAGAGGMGLGLEAAGMTHLLSFEIEKAQHSVLMNAGKLAIRMDLADVGNAAIAMRQVPDLIAGGPPCQDYSKQGKREEGERARLTRHFAQIICLQKPQWFLFENVPEAGESDEYKIARKLWKRHGYGLTEVVRDASYYGVPQTRSRFFCVGRMDEIDQFLLPEILAAASPKQMTIRDMLDPRRFPEDRDLLDKGTFFIQPWRGGPDEPNGRGVFSIDYPCRTISSHTREKASPSYIPHPKDSGPVEDAHLFTSEQAARIQGFPAEYDFQRKRYKYARGEGSGWPVDIIEKMIANAVPAPMAERLGRCIMERHYGKSIPMIDKGFTDYIVEESKRKSNTGKAMSKAAAYNVRAHLKRALRMVGGRVFANVWQQLDALENSYDKDEGIAYSKMSTRVRSDLKQALMDYHAYRTDPKRFPPSEWAPQPTKMPNFKSAPKHSGRKPRFSGTIPIGERRVISWPPAYSDAALDPQLAQVANLFDDGFRDDPYAPPPPAGDPTEDWRPEGYDDPKQDPDYAEYLASLKADD